MFKSSFFIYILLCVFSLAHSQIAPSTSIIHNEHAPTFAYAYTGSAIPAPPPGFPFEINTTNSEWDLWNQLLNSSLYGISINTITINGHDSASGMFKNMPLLNGIELIDGITFSTGWVAELLDDNAGDNHGGQSLGTPGNTTLDTYAPSTTSADVIQYTIDFTVPHHVKQFSFDLVYTSAEFPQYVNDPQFNDVFVALLDSVNISFDQKLNPLTVNNNYFEIDDVGNTTYPNGQISGGYAGLTPVLRTISGLTPGTHTLTFMIGDMGDQAYNSAILLSNLRFYTDSTGTGTGVITNEQTFLVYDQTPENTSIDTVNHTSSLLQEMWLLHPLQDFILDSMTGALTVAPGSTIDYDITQEYIDTVIVKYSTQTDTIPIKIKVIPIGETLPEQSFTALDQSPSGTIIDTLIFDTTDIQSLYFLTAEPDIELNMTSSEISVALTATLNRSVDSLYTNSVIVQYSLYSDTIPITITVQQLGALLDTQHFAIPDQTPGGTLIDTIAITSTGIHTFALTAPHPHIGIDSTTGELFLHDTTIVDRTVNDIYTAEVLINHGIYRDTIPVIITVLRISERLTEQFFTVHDKSTGGTIIGTVESEQLGLLSATFQTPMADIAFAKNDAQLLVKIGATIDIDITALYSNAILLEYQNYTDTVPITITVIKNIYHMPTAIDASLYDADGNGTADSIAITFIKKTVSEEVFTSASLQLSNGDTILIPPFNHITHTINDIYATQFIELLHPVPVTGISGIITLTYTVHDSIENQSIPIKDALGPVLVSAILHTNPQWNFPKLNLRFSESIVGYDSIPDGYFLVNETPLAIQELLLYTDSTWQFTIDTAAIKLGDTLRFIPHKHAADTLNNKAHTFNKAVQIELVELFSVRREGHAYHDLDSNGTLDALTVSFNKPLNDFLLDHLTIQFSWLDAAAQFISVPVQRGWISPHTLDSSKAFISIPPATVLKPFTTNIPTQASDFIKVSFALPGSDAESYTVPIIDSMAPIISRARLSNSDSDASDFSIFSDTLTVIFSEPIDTNQLAVEGLISLYRHSLPSPFSPTAIIWDDSTTLQLPLASSSTRSIAPGDSVTIPQITGGIHDLAGNSGAATKRVIEGNISLGIQATPMGTYTAPSDGGPSLTVEQVDSYRPLSEIMNEKGRGGVGIIIEGPKAPSGALVDLDPLYEFEIFVFSTTGQYINHFGGAFVLCSHRVDPTQQCVSDNQSLFLNWNMRTVQDRKVASGVYLIDYRINNSGNKQRGMISIGIKRDN